MTGSDVRPLRGEDLDRLGWADLTARARSFGEAQLLVSQVDEFDYLAACADGQVVGIGAAGYRTPWGGASLVSVAVDTRPGHAGPAAALIRRLEQRAGELTCSSIEVQVAAADVVTREVIEGQGYGLVGATTSVVPADLLGPGRAPGERYVDSWVLRKHL